MATQRLPFPEIQSWSPAVDPRAAENGNLYVLAGKNYAFDSKGLVSAFGVTAIAGGSLDSDLGLFQSLDLNGHVVLAGPTGISDLRWSAITTTSLTPSTEYWNSLYTYTREKDSRIGKQFWTAAYVGYNSYICHPQHGLLRLLGDSASGYDGIAGPESPLAITESNGRLIVLNATTVSWSSPFDAQDFTPALGGAGFQVVAERVPGTPVMVTSYPGGFITWTTQGILLSEYVGGEAVFRHTRIESEQLMLNPSSHVVMPDGTLVFATQQGLFKTTTQSSISALNPMFNEYLREVLKTGTTNHIRLYYSLETDRLFVQLMNETAVFDRTFVFSMSIEKWGEFSTQHRGIVRFTADPKDIGYIALDGQAYRFNDSAFNSLADGTKTGIDSYVDLGYFRIPGQLGNADIELEIQEVVISAVETYPTNMSLIEEDWGGTGSLVSYNIGFYNQDENWNAYGVADFDESWNNPGAILDWNDTGATLDLSLAVAGVRDFDWNLYDTPIDWAATPEGGVDTSYIEDWESLEGEEDWSGQISTFNDVDYDMEIHSNLDGYLDPLVVYPSLALRQAKSDLWVTMTAGQNHRMRISATAPWQKYHIKQIAVTVGYQGQIS